MSIQSGDGVLEILDGTLKVSRLDIRDISGLDVGINTLARNMVLLRDDQTAATVPGGGVSASSGISRDTGNEETVFTGGYVYWPIKVPNAWTMQFKVLGALIFSFSNTSEPASSVASANHGGYKMVFDSANSRFSFYYQGTEIEATRTDYNPLTLTRVLINYEYGGISVVLDDDLVMNYALTHGEDAYTGEYVGFAGTDGAKVKDIKLTNGDKWQYTADSNASSIAYLNGNVGIGTSSPQKTLDVRGDARVTGNLFVTGSTFVVDQQNLSVKDKIIELGGDNTEASSNVGMILTTGTTGSNVAIGYRGEESELIIGFTSNIATESELTPKAGASLTTKIYGTLETTGTTTASAFIGDGSGLTNVTLAQVAGYGNTTSNTIQFTGTATSLITFGNVAVGTTTALVDLAIGDANTGLNQEGEDELAIYTGGQERLRVDASGNVGIGVASPEQTLHIAGTQYINGLPRGSGTGDDGAKLLVTGQTTSTTPESLITITRPANTTSNVASKATLKLSRWTTEIPTSSRSKLDFALSSGAYSDEVVPLTLQANQKIGIANTSPQHTLSVGTDMYVDSEGLTVSNNAYVTNKLTVQGFRIVANEYTGLQAVTQAGNETSNIIIISNVTQSTSQTTGALTISGGVGIGKDLYASKIVAGGDLVVDTNTLYVNSSTNNVGIGSGSPNQKLDVVGSAIVSGNVGIGTTDPDAPLTVQVGGTNGTVRTGLILRTPESLIGTGYNLDFYQSTALVGRIASLTEGNGQIGMAFSTYNGGTAERMRIDASGNVGIGTGDPGYTLHVHNNLSTSGHQICARIGGATSSYSTLVFGTKDGKPHIGGHKGDFLAWDDLSLQNGVMTIQLDGRVGIGTTNPVAKLDIYAGQYVDSRLKLDGGGFIGRSYYYNSADRGSSLHFTDAAILPADYNYNLSNGGIELGWSTYRWGQIYSTSSTISTSDRNLKQDIADITDSERRVASKIIPLLKTFRMKDAVEKKGDEARTHTGIIAQDLIAAFESEGLDAHRYGLFCYDEKWTVDGEHELTETVYQKNSSSEYTNEDGDVIKYTADDEGVEAVKVKIGAFATKDTPGAILDSTMYSIRYEELLCFIVSAMATEEKVATLETQLASVMARLDALESNA